MVVANCVDMPIMIIMLLLLLLILILILVVVVVNAVAAPGRRCGPPVRRAYGAMRVLG